MSTDENKAIARRVVEDLFGKGNLAVADELIAADVVDHDAFPGQAPGRDGQKQHVTLLHAGFTEIRFTIQDVIAEGDKVMDHWTATMTHHGEFMGILPSGKQVTITGIDISRIADGRMVELWHREDTLGLLQQLGAIPTPEQAPR